MERPTYIIFSFLMLISCSDSKKKGNQIESNPIDVAAVSENLVDSLSQNGIREIILYRVDCENCSIKLPAYVIWKYDEQEFTEKINTNGQRIRISARPFIFGYIREMEGLFIEEVSEARDTTITNFNEARHEILKVLIDGKKIVFPPCELCLAEKHKSHHVFRDYITTRLFRDEMGELFVK